MREIGDGTRRFFRTKGKPTPVKRISSRRIVARFFHPELVAFINPPSPPLGVHSGRTF